MEKKPLQSIPLLAISKRQKMNYVICLEVLISMSTHTHNVESFYERDMSAVELMLCITSLKTLDNTQVFSVRLVEVNDQSDDVSIGEGK